MAILLSATGDKHQAGFTLVEMLVVLAIMACMIGMVPVLIAAGRPGLEARAEARMLAHDMQTARFRAMEGGVETALILDGGAARYRITPGGPERILPAPAALQFQAAQPSWAGRPSGKGRIAFFPDGSSSGGTILLGPPQSRHQITVHWLTGRVSIDG